MSMFNDVLGFGRSSIYESMMDDTIEPEIADMTLENAADIDEDPMDFMLRAAYENEINMMNLDTAIIAEEYVYLRENGQEMVTEAGKIETIINKAKEMIQKLWSKIQAFFKKVITKIDQVLKLDQRFMDKYKDKIGNNTAKVRGSIGLLNIDRIQKRGIELLDSIGQVGQDIFNKQKTKDKSSDKDETMKKLADVINSKSLVLGLEGETSKDLLRAMVENYKGDKDSLIVVKGTDALTSFEHSKDAKAAIKQAYETNKKHINGWIKGLKKYETSTKSYKIIPTEMSKQIHESIKSLNKVGSVLMMANRALVKCINMSRSFCKAAIIQAAAKSDPNLKDKNESASLIESFDVM